jgi:hypothetical protein
MLPQSGPPLGPEKILEFRANAKVLSRTLQNELAALTLHQSSSTLPLKDIYDSVYLPKTLALADGLTGFDIPDLDQLRRPFCPEQASAQLLTVIGVLTVIASVLSPN